MPEERIREYIVECLIGRGGMGSVYLARHVHLNTKAALKVLLEHYSDDISIKNRFINEARLLHDLQHPNIVQQKEFFQENGHLVLVMEYIDGRGLDRMIGQEVGPIPWEKALPLFIQILDGLAYAHGEGIVHRDIKPANILVSRDGKVKITDLGIAKIAGQKGITRTGTQMGTLFYESPEQIKGARDADQRSDIYSLGMTLFEMLAGRLPFDGEGDTSEFQVMNSIVNRVKHLDPRVYYPHIPDWLVELVQKATDLDPAKRFQSCEEFRSAIEKHGNLSSNENSYWSDRVSSAPEPSLSESRPISEGSSSHAASQDTCPKCGFSIREEMEFCPECGQNLMQKCPSCNSSMRWYAKHCPKCGTNIADKLASIKAETERKRLEEIRKQEEKRIAEKKRREELERLKNEREAERQRVEKERKKQEELRLKKLEEMRIRRVEWWRKHRSQVIVFLALFTIGSSVLLYLNSDGYAYKQASALEESHRWSEAYAAFGELNGYRDSSDRAGECGYRYGLELIESGNNEEAIAVFEGLGSYRDSASRALAIRWETMAEFVTIPSGSFQMGSPSTESAREDNEKQHLVTVDAFELMTTEVTQGMWEEVMGSNPAHDYGVGDNYPVYNLSWDDCQEFIDRLNEMDPSHTYRLPSESEWEYACRAGTTTRFYWGDSDSESTMGRYCWYTENSNSTTHPVAQKEPNAWGLYDMSGNVWEWCEDKYTSDYDDCPTDGRAYTGSGSSRVYRGGSWGSNARNCRSAFRFSDGPGSRYNDLGFRVTRSV